MSAIDGSGNVVKLNLILNRKFLNSQPSLDGNGWPTYIAVCIIDLAN